MKTETMKRSKYIKTLSAVLMLLTASLLTTTSLLITSCEKADLGALDNGDSNGSGNGSGNGSSGGTSGTSSTAGSHKVTIIARSASTQDITYPIEIYAYNSLGEETAHQTVSSASEGISMSLPEGQYTIAAISGASISSSSSSSSGASEASGSSSFDFTKGYSTTPVMTGSTTVTVGSSALTANIVLSYAVASLDISMTDVPESVTAVSVTVASQYKKVTDLREYSGTGSVTIPCSKAIGAGSSNTWQTGTIYLLPGCKESTELTIALTSASGTTSYGITYPSALKAATPYHFTGSYSGESSGVKLTGSISCDDWLAGIDDSFSFGPSGTNAFSGQEGDIETIKVSSIPEQGTVYDGHLVALVSTASSTSSSGSTADALLISVKEWSGLTSALYEADPTVAAKLAEGYVEGSMANWSIPTNSQVKELKEVWSAENIGTLNTALAGISGSDELVVSDENGKNVRYLCEKATYTYAWSKTAGIVAAGKTVKTYRLRLVRKVRFSK